LRTVAIATTYAAIGYRSFRTVPIMSQHFPIVKGVMNSDRAEGMVESILAEADMEELRDYLARGRRFQGEDTGRS
jgi:hypothetical protein